MSEQGHVTDLLPAYALGAAEADEAARVESHLPACAACRQELEALEAVTAALPLAMTPMDPPAVTRTRLMARIQTEEAATEAPVRWQAVASQLPAVRPTSFWQQLTAVLRGSRAAVVAQAALVLLVAVLVTSNVLLWRQVRELENGPGPGQLQAVHLDSTGVYPEAEGYLTISHDGLSGAIVLDQLPQLGDDQQYQLWLVKNGQRTSGAVLSVDELGYGGNRVRPPESLFNYAWAEVTIEQAEGSLQPTGAVILRAPLFP